MGARRFRIDAAKVKALKAQGLTKTQIAERLGCSLGGVSYALSKIAKATKLREGDVMIVQRLPRNQPGKLPDGFKIGETAGTHHARFAVNATKILRKGA